MHSVSGHCIFQRMPVIRCRTPDVPRRTAVARRHTTVICRRTPVFVHPSSVVIPPSSFVVPLSFVIVSLPSIVVPFASVVAPQSYPRCPPSYFSFHKKRSRVAIVSISSYFGTQPKALPAEALFKIAREAPMPRWGVTSCGPKQSWSMSRIRWRGRGNQ